MKDFAYQLDDFADLLRTTAAWKNLPPAAVEKDYFVVYALRILQSQMPDHFIFKGGTSLSKGWDLIKRFSEDIDLLFVSKKGPEKISKNELDRRMKKAEAFLRAETCFESALKNSSTGVHRSVILTYPKNYEVAAGFSDTILVEMGVRGGDFPQTMRKIQSYVGEYAKNIGENELAGDLAPFEVNCLDYRRTFVEKLFSIHAAFENNKGLGKMRHYYDLYQLAGLEETKEFLLTEEYINVHRDVEEFSQTCFSDAALPSDIGFAGSAAIHPDGDSLKELKSNYTLEKDLFFNDPPTLEEILERLQTLEFIKPKTHE